MKVGFILRGLMSVALGPVWTFGSNLISYITGAKSMRSVAMSLGFSGLLDAGLDFEDIGYEIDPNPPESLRSASIKVARSVLEYGAAELLEGYDMSRSSSGLYVAKASLVDVRGSQPRVQSILRPSSERTVCGQGGGHRTLRNQALGRTLQNRSLG